MCARQHGDICNIKDKCDTRQGLYCDMSRWHGPGIGICRAETSKPCVVNGKTYVDGETFQPECSRLCTCQNGNYGCVNLCPDEYRKPSQTHCKRPRMMPVKGQCCKQWTCDVRQRLDSESSIRPRHAVMVAKPGELRMKPQMKALYPSFERSTPNCRQNTTEWSHCSATCDIGISTRKYYNKDCEKKDEIRLCYLRPCGTIVQHNDREKCTPTTRFPAKQHVRYQDCVSVQQLRFKFCTSCKTNRCCYPRKTKTRHIQFECNGGRRERFAFMWIKSCRCDRICYTKDKDDKNQRIDKK